MKSRRAAGLGAVGFLPKRRGALSKCRRLQTRDPDGRRDLPRAGPGGMSVAGTQVGKQDVGLTSNRPPLREAGFVVPVCSADSFRDFPRLYQR